MRIGETRVVTRITESEKRLCARFEDIKENFKDVKKDITGLKVDTQSLIQRQNELESQDVTRLGDRFLDCAQK